ncbi:hypothetical protein MMJ50_12780 [Enterococcus cecorum]|uniref:hypothetical protein n=1 Tax=Enterococcus cecorum TaxID=44008 RepID=UPI001FAD0FFA|nr:hypothetical protein [Enterococcus cecorum]MCJ0593527.1 hypothetical protein [Enterococcus cecorum]
MKKLTKKQAKKMFKSKVKQGVATKEQINFVKAMSKVEGITTTLVYPHELLKLGYTEEQIAELYNKQALIII